tara:strand:- start:25 stop:447 length:423 start_codon:yes stop_codon:yes gene_type:complete
VLNLALSLTYKGWRNYTEIKVDGSSYGFAPGMTRTDVPESYIKDKIIPSLAFDATIWVVEGHEPVKVTAKDMLETIETPNEEKKASESEPTQENATVADEDTPDYSSLTRAKLMSLAKSKGLTVSPSDKKVDLIARLQGE